MQQRWGLTVGVTTAFLLGLALSSAIQPRPALNRRINATLLGESDLAPFPAATQVYCDGTHYRSGLDIESCMDAFEAIPDDRQYVRIGSRSGLRNYAINLPARWISGKVPSFCLAVRNFPAMES